MTEQERIIQEAMEERFRQEKQQKVMNYRHRNRYVRPHQILFVGSSLMEQFPVYELLLDQQLPFVIKYTDMNNQSVAACRRFFPTHHCPSGFFPVCCI